MNTSREMNNRKKCQIGRFQEKMDDINSEKRAIFILAKHLSMTINMKKLNTIVFRK